MTTQKDLEKAIELVSEYFSFPIDDVDATNLENMRDCVPKSIVKDVARALAAERASLPESVVKALEMDDIYGWSEIARRDLEAWMKSEGPEPKEQRE